ncbi:hypothetical protein CSIM01_13640 [Colletotrichum simmondsii]|uniref:Protein DSF2 n=1 Tax=Colletotrichum simmondsii TaxID=703756 RepID=A0A135U065_9PEZI|nr:hypothetical protein CSIM01_13640 [Colletotrichum simmondsii]
MGIRDVLKKKEKLDNGEHNSKDAVDRLAAPEFKFIRSDTHTQEVIHPPSGPPGFDDGKEHYLNPNGNDGGSGQKPRRSLDVFFGNSRSRSASASSQASSTSNSHSNNNGKIGRRLSERLHLSRSPASSENVPQNLPDIVTTAEGGEGDELQWEKRATMLASANKSRPATPLANDAGGGGDMARGRTQGAAVSSPAIDEDIQEAIRLHEAGDFENSTAMFARLADPKGANNTLSQFLYGLSLRHGWGCEPDPEGAIKYLSAAASNAATVEQMALKAGLKKGGAAKGELVLAIFELANSFRHGWGTAKDPIAAKQYYETAANLGDTDAMNEVAWCYVEGFGCKKDKFAAARYYRLAEKNGNKTLGNSWLPRLYSALPSPQNAGARPVIQSWTTVSFPGAARGYLPLQALLRCAAFPRAPAKTRCCLPGLQFVAITFCLPANPLARLSFPSYICVPDAIAHTIWHHPVWPEFLCDTQWLTTRKLDRIWKEKYDPDAGDKKKKK